MVAKKKKIINTSLFLFNDQYFVVEFRGNFRVIIMPVYQKLRTTQSYWYAAWVWVRTMRRKMKSQCCMNLWHLPGKLCSVIHILNRPQYLLLPFRAILFTFFLSTSNIQAVCFQNAYQNEETHAENKIICNQYFLCQWVQLLEWIVPVLKCVVI